MKTKELIELEHKYKMEEIEAEKKAKIEIEKIKFDYVIMAQKMRSEGIRKTQQRKYRLEKKNERNKLIKGMEKD